jgi:hypothetical protein
MRTCPVGCFHIHQIIVLHIIYLQLILVSEKPILASDTGLLNILYKWEIIFKTQQMKSVLLYTFWVDVSLQYENFQQEIMEKHPKASPGTVVLMFCFG